MFPEGPNTLRFDALVLCNGDLTTPGHLFTIAKHSNSIIAADGAANQAAAMGLYPHVVVGDLDSVTSATLKLLKDALIVRAPDQNKCDFEKALDYAIDAFYKKIAVVGMEGGRFDFTLSNFSVIWRYVDALDLFFYGETWYAIPMKKKQTLSVKVGSTVSFIPFGECHGITLEGLAYPLQNATFKVGDSGVSNKAIQPEIHVRVDAGHLLMVVLN